MEQADLDALGQYFTQEQVIELALTIATANWTNRVNEGLQVPHVLRINSVFGRNMHAGRR